MADVRPLSIIQRRVDNPTSLEFSPVILRDSGCDDSIATLHLHASGRQMRAGAWQSAAYPDDY